MKTIPVREFQQNARHHLKRLPVILTKYNLPVAMVVPFKGVSVDTPVEKSEIKPQSVDTNSQYEAEKEEPNDYPKYFMGKPLSGKKQSCPICYEIVPVEFAQQHYLKKHGDI